MTLLPIAIGTLIFLVAVVVIVNPAYISRVLRKHQQRPALRWAAVIVRLLVGVLLLSLADLSRFPLAIKSIAWISILAAVFLLLSGQDKFQQLVLWALNRENLFMRAGGVVGMVLGVFVVYAFY